MGGGGQGALAAEIQERSGAQAERLNKSVLDNLGFLFTNLSGKFGTDWNAIPGEVSRGFDKARSRVEEGYASARFGADEASQYLAKTSGAPLSGGEVRHRMTEDALALDLDWRLTLGQISLDEANAGLSANNALMRLFTGGGQTALGLAATYQNQAVNSASMVNQQDPWMSALGGAASGAAAGSALGPWGTVIGGVIGGAGGYFGGR